MKVAVDPDCCAGHAHCWARCPEVFELTDDGYAIVRVDDVPPALEVVVQQAVDGCPTHAITVS
jgi:ferredoxin